MPYRDQHLHHQLPEEPSRAAARGRDAVGWQLRGGQSRDGSAEDQVVGRQLDADLTAAMRALPDRHRVVAYLVGVEGRSYREIADLTGIPLATVKSHLHRARCRLRAGFSAYAPRS
jgi:RNA polymerase sigma-70 factor, ECF subfamily